MTDMSMHMYTLFNNFNQQNHCLRIFFELNAYGRSVRYTSGRRRRSGHGSLH